MGSIYHNNNSYGKSIESPASDIILSSVMHIGGETQDNAEDAIVALSENSSGGSDLEDLSDVSIDSPVEGDYLEYDGTANIWINHMQYKIVTWANGTDREIIQLLEAHYRGDIDITDYWSVGDERIVHLNAISATGVGRSHVAQDVIMVLMNIGGKTLVTPINGNTECAFIVGQKDCFNEGGDDINSSDTNAGGWDSCQIRKWCNSIYKNALPSTIVEIFKQHQNETSDGGNSSTAIISNDYFALPSEKEVFGYTRYSNSTAEANNIQFKYYETSSNRIKNANGSAVTWFERSSGNDNDRFCGVDNKGNVFLIPASSSWAYIAPFGVI